MPSAERCSCECSGKKGFKSEAGLHQPTSITKRSLFCETSLINLAQNEIWFVSCWQQLLTTQRQQLQVVSNCRRRERRQTLSGFCECKNIASTEKNFLLHLKLVESKLLLSALQPNMKMRDEECLVDSLQV